MREASHKLKIMKKQILILVFFTLALFVSTSTVYAQDAQHYSDPRPLSCTPDALHPIAGQEWTYAATASVAGDYHFYATKDPSFVTTSALQNGSAGFLNTPADLLTASANYDTPGTTVDVKITWSSAILANTDYQGTPDITGATPSPTFVVVYFDAADGCSDNIKVWELDPMNGFTVDVLAIDFDAPATMPVFGTVPATCLDNVESASYAAAAMVYDYGENYMYFEFVAANFSGSWTPTFDLSGLNAVQSVTSYEYTTDLPATWGGATVWAPLVSGTTSIPTTVANTSVGVSVFVRVLVDHANFEGIAGETLTMTLDGQNAAGEWDVVNGTGADTCADVGAADQNDTATSDFTARPAITDPAMPAPNLIPGNEQN